MNTAGDASVIQLVSSQLGTRQSYSWYHHSWGRVSHTAGIITAGDAAHVYDITRSVTYTIGKPSNCASRPCRFTESHPIAGMNTAGDAPVIQLVSSQLETRLQVC